VATVGAHATPDKLAPGAVLLRGELWNTTSLRATAAYAVAGATLMVIGGLLPYPAFLPARCRFDYRIEVLGADGRTLVSAQGQLDATYRHLFVWTVFGQDCAGPEVMTDVEMMLFEQLGRAFGAP
jgi:hypothetical protein